MALTQKKRRLMALTCFLFFLALLVTAELIFGRIYYFKRNQDLLAFQWDSQTLWQFKPGFKGKTFGVRVKINESGFRGEEIPISPKSGLRILALGDSRTYGFLIDEEWTFSSVLQKEMRQRGYENTQVINGGVFGYSAVQCNARFKQLLYYKPDIAIFSAGHNDRRYLLLTPPDSIENFRYMAWTRMIVDTLSFSKVFYGIFYELSHTKLQNILENPPNLDTVSVRVDANTFEKELQLFVDLCRRNDILPVFLQLEHNPEIFNPLETAAKALQDNQPEKALTLLQNTLPDLHISGRAYCHYLMGKAYEALEKHKPAQTYYAKHEPIGSIHGEALLRPQQPYFDSIKRISKQNEVLIVKSHDAFRQINNYVDQPAVQMELKKEIEQKIYEQMEYNNKNVSNITNSETNVETNVETEHVDLENFIQNRYIDECHMNNLAHFLIGKKLADTLDTALQKR